MNVIQFPQLGKHGRMGNSLFQIASTIGIARANGCEPRFPKDWRYRYMFNIPDEWFADMLPLPALREKQFEYREVKAKNVSLYGYFQSQQYWQHCKEEVVKLLGGYAPTEQVCGIHHRRGDYVNNPNYATLPMRYYVDSYLLQYLLTGITDIAAVGDDAAFIDLHYSQKTYSELHDFAALQHCSSKVISNSTFAWWAAYLSNGTTIRPLQYFAGALAKNSTGDFWPQEWIEEPQPTNQFYSQFAFVIPVKYDHQDRLINCRTVVNYLKEHFPYVPVYIGEMDGEYFKGIGDHIRYDLGGVMHRTKVINLLTKHAASRGAKYCFNWDADVITPPMQIANAMALLHKGADVVYPYDGRFYWMERRELPHIKGDLSGLVGKRFKTVGATVRDSNSYGGAVGYNIERFFDAGGENENFVSYGPEDQERWYRFNLLLSSVKRTFGGLYHINHFRGTDSSFRHKNGHSNMKYWQMEIKMTKQKLIEQIKTWGWSR